MIMLQQRLFCYCYHMACVDGCTGNPDICDQGLSNFVCPRIGIDLYAIILKCNAVINALFTPKSSQWTDQRFPRTKFWLYLLVWSLIAISCDFFVYTEYFKWITTWWIPSYLRRYIEEGCCVICQWLTIVVRWDIVSVCHQRQSAPCCCYTLLSLCQSI